MSKQWMTLADLKRLLPNASLKNFNTVDLAQEIHKFGSDSRQIENGELFIAIKGERFDGNAYLNEVSQKGALAAIASSSKDVPDNFPVFLVNDTIGAIQELSKAWRQELGTRLAVVTGSNGKTTVKEMIASIFAETVGDDQSLATRGNLNNDIGLPMTLLRLNRGHQLGVIELGMNHPGETSVLAQIAAPDVALINNAQREHQEFMKDVQAVAKEHSAVIDALNPDGIAVFPADDQYASLWKTKAGARSVIDFEFSPHGLYKTQAKIRGSWKATGVLLVQLLGKNNQSFEVKLSTLGHHNARNALAAIAVACAFEISIESIQRGLSKFVPVAGRMQVKDIPKTIGHGILIDDTYNANPDSVRAAVDVLAELEGQRWLALGDMGEVGVNGPAYHREVGEYARERGIDYLFATGELTQESVLGFNQPKSQPLKSSSAIQEAQHFEDVQALTNELLMRMTKFNNQTPSQSLAILVKGSRFMRMERVVNNLLKGEGACC